MVINYANSASEATTLVAELREAGHQAIAVQANVANASDVARLFDETEQQLGKVDILVNNAGVPPGMPGSLRQFKDLADSDFERQLDLNLRAAGSP